MARAYVVAAVTGAGAFVAPAPVLAEVVEFPHCGYRDAWFAAAGPVTTIGFSGLPDGTFITDQYQEQGVLFLGGDDNIACCSRNAFPQDGAGLDGNSTIHLEFLSPQRWIAADYPGGIKFLLYFEGATVYESSNFLAGGPGSGGFAGLISTTPFDEALLYDWVDGKHVLRQTLQAGGVAGAQPHAVMRSSAHEAAPASAPTPCWQTERTMLKRKFGSRCANEAFSL